MKAVKIFETLKGVSNLLADQLYPPKCPACFVPTDTHGNLCGGCFAKLHVISEPYCEMCGVPFSIAQESETQCVPCLSDAPSFTRARSIWVYNHISARMVKSLKLEDRAPMLEQFTHLMLRAAGPFIAETDVIVPVPMHWKSLLIRRYNPSVWLAGSLAQRAGIPCESGYLIRARPARPQRGLKRAERLKNLRKVFQVPEKQKMYVKGKSILLVDDVITTGATANACADALLKVGAKRVDVVTLAHTMLEGE